jgi:hypothetical protein
MVIFMAIFCQQAIALAVAWVFGGVMACMERQSLAGKLLDGEAIAYRQAPTWRGNRLQASSYMEKQSLAGKLLHGEAIACRQAPTQ